MHNKTRLNALCKGAAYGAIVGAVLSTVVFFARHNPADPTAPADTTYTSAATCPHELDVLPDYTPHYQPRPTKTPMTAEPADTTLCDLPEWTSHTPQDVPLGTFRISHYCIEPYNHICGNGKGITSTGNPAIPYRTVSVDPEVIPLGSIIKIAGCDREYIADDTGGWVKGNRLDVCVATHDEALQAGILYAEVFIYACKSS
jgi:3D (Asp-Asp-Asp) domain-containing protein